MFGKEKDLHDKVVPPIAIQPHFNKNPSAKHPRQQINEINVLFSCPHYILYYIPYIIYYYYYINKWRVNISGGFSEWRRLFHTPQHAYLGECLWVPHHSQTVWVTVKQNINIYIYILKKKKRKRIFIGHGE